MEEIVYYDALFFITWTDCALQGKLRHAGAIWFMFQPLECKFRQMECKFQPMERRIHRYEIFFTSGPNNCSIGAQQLRQRGVAIAAKGCSNFHRLTSPLTVTAIGQGVRRIKVREVYIDSFTKSINYV